MSLEMDVPICVVGKVFKPNRQKVLALNQCLSGFMQVGELPCPKGQGLPVSTISLAGILIGYSRGSISTGST